MEKFFALQKFDERSGTVYGIMTCSEPDKGAGRPRREENHVHVFWPPDVLTTPPEIQPEEGQRW